MASDVSNNNRSFFCIPQPGKPDPYQPWDPSSKELRGRVVDHGQKGVNCTYYGLQLLRNNWRIGKKAPNSLIEKRALEQAISAHRKVVSKINADHQWRISFACQITETLSGSCTREAAQKIISDPSSIGKKHQANCCAALKEFCAQDKYDEFFIFAKETYSQALLKADMDFLKKQFKLSNQEIVSSVSPKSGLEWGKMGLEERVWHVRSLVFLHSYRAYGCRESLWHPEQHFDALMKGLEAYGPHMVQGLIGQIYYEDEPFPLKDKIEGRPVFGWKPEAKRTKITERHCVLLVGARIQNGKKLVYFIDPLDGSDPKDITTQKVYVMSFEKLQKSICNLQALSWWNAEDNLPVFDPMKMGPNNYALHM